MNFEHVKRNDSIVAAMVAGGASLEDIIVALADSRKHLIEQIVQLTGIAPKAFVLPNGETIIWHCPDDLIPRESLGEPSQPKGTQ